MKSEYENATPLNIQLDWTGPEVDAAVDAIFTECVDVAGIKKKHLRMKDCLKVVLTNLYSCYLSDPTQYIRYSRSHRSWFKQYNCLDLSVTQIVLAVDRLYKLEYVTCELGDKWKPGKKDLHQSCMRATDKLIERIWMPLRWSLPVPVCSSIGLSRTSALSIKCWLLMVVPHRRSVHLA